MAEQPSASGTQPAVDTATPRPAGRRPAEDRGARFITAVGVERLVRAVALVAVAAVLVLHARTGVGPLLQRLIERAGLDPSSNTLGRLLDKAGAVTGARALRDAGVAAAYGLLEGVESIGLLRRRDWAEYLTVVSTAVLLAPEIDELAHKATTLKVVALVLNLIVLAYLVVRLVRKRRRNRQQSSTGSW